MKRFPDGSLRRPDGTISGSDIMLREAVARVARLGAGSRAALAMASANPRRWLGIPSQ